jgi:hypothetical protein
LCWGAGHEYQWRHPRELREATIKATATDEAPSDAGGFGYTRNRDPNPICPDCDGYGIGFTVIRDMRKPDPRDARLFQGIKQTRDGVTVAILDQTAAVNRLADYFGIHSKQGDNTIANAFTDMLGQLLRAGGPHTKAPIRKDPAPGEGK